MRCAALLPLAIVLGSLLITGQAPAKVIVVQPKATLWGIAKKHGVTVEAIRKVNDLEREDVLRAGQKLRIPNKRKRKPGKRTGSKSKKRKTAASKTAASKTAASKTAKQRKSSKRSGKPPAWVHAKPPRWTQTQKTKAERGGINPCNTPNPGWGNYTKWNRAPSLGQMVLPNNKKLIADGQFDVIFHFHGHEPIRKEWVQVMDRTVLVAVSLGVSSAPYVHAFGSSQRFEQLVASVEKEVARYVGRKKAHARNIGLSSWSAGYGALLRILATPYGKRRVDSVSVLDGMHSSYLNGKANVTQLAPFIAFAKEAAKGRKHMFISHSSIIPPGYASSTETANLLLYEIGARPRRAKPRNGDPMGLELISRYSDHGLHVRGFAGNDKMDHCAHIGLFRDVLRVHIKPRWRG